MSDADNGALLWSVGSPSPYLGHIKEILFFSQDGRHVAAEFSDCVSRAWRVEDGECVASERTPGYMHCFSKFARDGRVLVVGRYEENLEAFRIIEL